VRRRHHHVWSTLVIVIVATVAVVSACAPPAPPPAKEAKPAAGASAVSGDADNGKQLFASKGCIACHVAQGVPGATGTIGPNLNGIGDPSKRPTLADGATNTPEHIREWIIDPQKAKPGTMMPNLGLSAKDADDLTAFMATLTR
jgi:cytochrome c2